METVFRFNDGIEIVWNGSATFNLFIDGMNVDCFTVRGEYGYGCTYEEAAEAAERHYEEMMSEIE